MFTRILPAAPDYSAHVEDLAAKYLSRTVGEWATPAGATRRHHYFGVVAPGDSGRFCEAWRFPVVEPHYDAALTPLERTQWNEVTFI